MSFYFNVSEQQYVQYTAITLFCKRMERDSFQENLPLIKENTANQRRKGTAHKDIAPAGSASSIEYAMIAVGTYVDEWEQVGLSVST